MRAAAVFVIVGGLVAAWAAQQEPKATFCTADGLIVDGEILGRDPDQDCRFVDAEGRVIDPQP